MNRSNIEHVLYALAMQAAIALATGDWWLGAAFAAGFFCGREHAQAEERYISRCGVPRDCTPRAPEFAAFNPSLWTADALLDFVLPSVVVLAVAMVWRSAFYG